MSYWERRPPLRSALLPGYRLLFGVHRFVAGFLRGDPPGVERVPGLRTDQVICVAYVAEAVAVLLVLARGRSAPPRPAAEPVLGPGPADAAGPLW